jgi:hypothetical protein
MLTASLQSTWEQKNRQPSRQKYGSYQSGYGAGSEETVDFTKSIAYGAQDRALGRNNNNYSLQQGQQQNSYYPSAGGTAAELPNLKMPQVSCFNDVVL